VDEAPRGLEPSDFEDWLWKREKPKHPGQLADFRSRGPRECLFKPWGCLFKPRGCLFKPRGYQFKPRECSFKPRGANSGPRGAHSISREHSFRSWGRPSRGLRCSFNLQKALV